MPQNNLDHCSSKIVAKVASILKRTDVSDMSKKIIRTGLEKDCVDAVSHAQLATNILRDVRDDILNR